MKQPITTQELSRRDTPLGVVLDSLYDGVYIVDPRRRILFWNHGAEKITGFNASEVMGRRCADNILNHIDADGNLLCKSGCPLLKAIRTGQEIEAKVYPLYKDGQRFPTLTHVAPIRNETGEIIAGIEIFRDITLEEDFRHLQEKFNSLIKKYVSTATFDEVITQVQAGDNVASRIQNTTGPDTIAISEATYGRLHANKATHFDFLRNVSVKGKKKPIPIFQHRP